VKAYKRIYLPQFVLVSISYLVLLMKCACVISVQIRGYNPGLLCLLRFMQQTFLLEIIIPCVCTKLGLWTCDISDLCLRTLLRRCEIWDLYGDEDCGTLGHDTVQPNMWLLTLQRNMLLPSSDLQRRNEDRGTRVFRNLVNFLSDTASLPRRS
jgi:hypothetical protein